MKIFSFAGSTRSESYNERLVRVAARGAEQRGAAVTHVRLRDFPLPLYDGDLEAAEGLPEPARRLKQLFREHDALLISSPEYNSSISGVLKNALDWVSRPEPGEPSLVAFAGKVAGLLSASPGALGGLRGLMHLRSLLGNIQVLVIPEQFALAQAHEAFDNDGSLKSQDQQKKAERIGARLAEIAGKLCSYGEAG